MTSTGRTHDSTLGRSSHLPSFCASTCCTRRIATYSITAVFTVYAPFALAHEYWLDPIHPTLSTDSRLLVDARNGQDFVGSAFPYDPERFRSAIMVRPSGTVALTSRLGDYPAFHVTPTEPGTHQIAVTTSLSLLSYDTRADFNEFLDYHGFTDNEQRNLFGDQSQIVLPEFNIPDFNIQEGYYRYAKTFVQVNSPSRNEHQTQGISHQLDHAFELVPDKDPTLCESTLALTLIYNDQPVDNRQIEVFHKHVSEKEDVTRTLTRTDSTGLATIQTDKAGDYMINSVVIDAPDTVGLHLSSHWTSMTFSCS